MELKKKECYHKNVQKITRTAGTLAYCKPHPQQVPVVIIFYIRSGGTENAEDRVKV